MAGGTLLVSRSVNNHAYFKKRLEALGFYQVSVTDLEKDALYFLIRDLRPKLLIMSAYFYSCSTPYLMGELHKKFPKINLVAISLINFPADLAMYFILNGVGSYISFFEGVDQFYKGLNMVANGIDYVSPEVKEQLEIRKNTPDPACFLSEKNKQIIRLICCGYKDHEIADELAISRSTVANRKTKFFSLLNIKSNFDLYWAARSLGIARYDEKFFYPKKFTLNPLPDKELMKRSAKK